MKLQTALVLVIATSVAAKPQPTPPKNPSQAVALANQLASRPTIDSAESLYVQTGRRPQKSCADWVEKNVEDIYTSCYGPADRNLAQSIRVGNNYANAETILNYSEDFLQTMCYRKKCWGIGRYVNYTEVARMCGEEFVEPTQTFLKMYTMDAPGSKASGCRFVDVNTQDTRGGNRNVSDPYHCLSLVKTSAVKVQQIQKMWKNGYDFDSEDESGSGPEGDDMGPQNEMGPNGPQNDMGPNGPSMDEWDDSGSEWEEWNNTERNDRWNEDGPEGEDDDFTPGQNRWSDEQWENDDEGDSKEKRPDLGPGDEEEMERVNSPPNGDETRPADGEEMPNAPPANPEDQGPEGEMPPPKEETEEGPESEMSPPVSPENQGPDGEMSPPPNPDDQDPEGEMTPPANPDDQGPGGEKPPATDEGPNEGPAGPPSRLVKRSAKAQNEFDGERPDGEGPSGEEGPEFEMDGPPEFDGPGKGPESGEEDGPEGEDGPGRGPESGEEGGPEGEDGPGRGPPEETPGRDSEGSGSGTESGEENGPEGEDGPSRGPQEENPGRGPGSDSEASGSGSESGEEDGPQRGPGSDSEDGPEAMPTGGSQNGGDRVPCEKDEKCSKRILATFCTPCLERTPLYLRKQLRRIKSGRPVDYFAIMSFFGYTPQYGLGHVWAFEQFVGEFGWMVEQSCGWYWNQKRGKRLMF